MASTIHALSAADFTGFTYHQVYIPGGQTVMVQSQPITTVSDVVLDVGIVNNTTTTGSTMYLIGKKKPETLLGNKLPNGDYNIKG